ncbi:MAG: hypothetical protein V4508_02410 [Pseudomonadota bacterium]
MSFDAVAGAQSAMMAALTVCIEICKGNPQVAEAIAASLEHTRANLLASQGSDRKLEVFDSIAESLISRFS